MHWLILPFDRLDTHQLYQLLRLRVDVFVVEQACPYPELDGLDLQAGTLHMLGYDNSVLVAYARAMPGILEAGHQPPLSAPAIGNIGQPGPESAVDQVKIGRILVHSDYRQQGIAHEMMQRLLAELARRWPAANLILSAQTQVASFYQRYGFVGSSEEYLEDGILHIDMQCTPMIKK